MKIGEHSTPGLLNQINYMWKLKGLGLDFNSQLVYHIQKLSTCHAETRFVELSVGRVKGRKRYGLYGHEFFSFEGIPYGKPPLGKLRFQPPKPAEPWPGKELDCLQEREVPMQVDRATGCAIGSEDCLYLNVYTKHLDCTEKPLPVLVYIYGGAFRSGGATRAKYGPDYLMREDVVLVFFNYRVCALGFLSCCSKELSLSGNVGLQDQLLALRWVQQHISHFNGDPLNVTLFGQSAGAASVHFMMCVPQAKGLFSKAIMMSGCMLNPWAQAHEQQMNCCRLAVRSGYEGPLTEACILKHLLSVPPERLVQHNMYSFFENCFGLLHPFVPGVDQCETSEGLLRRPYIELMRNAWSSRMPLLLGGTSLEGLVMYPICKLYNGFLLDILREKPTRVLPYELYRKMCVEERECRVADVLRCHFGPRNIIKNNVWQVLEMFGIKMFWHGLHRVVRSRLCHAQAPTYVYRFDFDSPTFNFMRMRLCGNDIKCGVCHADDLGYIFHKQGVEKLSPDSLEYATMQRMVSILTTFARSGNPNCEQTGPEEWLPVTQKRPYSVMNINRALEFIRQPESTCLEVWNNLYTKDLY
ncbi:esterase B1 [Scaptodrosophila lebanonensis]|uniref:carboxylesterase n=1 Tax=Drosophila lebanonensis TaxID=7225 RepID=A0A6J2TEM7_DROLE|nr:esterase B1 [Scaptodrosophila lebanonensis]